MKKKKVGHPKRTKEIAINCYYLDKNGVKEDQIADRYHWKKQEDDHGIMKSITARRYIRDGKKIIEERRKLGAKAFGIEYKPLVRVRCPNKPNDK